MLSKRIFDFTVAMCGLTILSPLFLIIIVFIKLTSPGPVLFCQCRVGQYQRLFMIYKFRTMVIDAEARGPKITIGCDARITSIGKILRKTKLDELPQLLNVALGHMSLVGPRPEVPEYVNYYPEQDKAVIFRLKPGITDWASIKMIDENDILAKAPDPQQAYITEILPKKLAYAVRYAQNRSFFLDVYLIGFTIVKLFIR